MLTGKQRAFLRGKANQIEVVAQIGKDGLSRSAVSGIGTALKARELVKVRVLPNSGLNTRAACDEVCAALDAEPVQTIGTIFVLFRQKDKDSAFELPKP